MRKTRRMNPPDGPNGPEADPLCGRVLAGRYRLHERLGAGGFGAVYAASDLAHGIADCAVKIALTSGPEAVDAGVRLHREAEILRRTRSPSVVRHIDHGESDGLRFLVMERLRGSDLAGIVRSGRLIGPGSVDRLGLLAGCFRAVANAHDLDVAHGDIKPNNIFLTDAGEVKLIDFGAAALLASHATLPPGTDDRFSVTQPGIVLASPGYTAPERLERTRADCDPRAADIFSLGAIAYLLVMLRPAVPGEGLAAALWTTTHDIEVPREGAAVARMRPAAFERLAALIRGATHRNPAQRTPSARHLLDQLELARHRLGNSRSEPLSVDTRRRISEQAQPKVRGAGVGVTRPRPPARAAFVFALFGAVGLWTGFAWSRANPSVSPVEPPLPSMLPVPVSPAARVDVATTPSMPAPRSAPVEAAEDKPAPSLVPSSAGRSRPPRPPRPPRPMEWPTYEPGLFPLAPNAEEP